MIYFIPCWKTRPIRNFLILFFLSLFIANQSVLGQNTFDSAYSVRPGVVGHAVFTYKLKNQKKIKTGEFMFQSKEQKLGDSSIVFSSESWRGNYESDEKIGEWKYKLDENLAKILGLENEELSIRMLNKNSSLKAQYKKGIPDGSWDYIRTRNYKGEEEEVRADIQVEFKEGLIDGDVFCTINDSNGKAVISGQAINGLYRGTWKIKYEDFVEIRKYKRGVLLSLTQRNENDTLLHLEYPLSEKIKNVISDTSEINKMTSSGRLNFRDGYPSHSKYVVEQKKGNYFIKKMLKHMHQYDMHLFDEKHYALGSYRAKYPFTEDEKKWLNDWDSIYHDYKNLIRKISDEELLSLELSKDRLVSLVFHWLKAEEKLIENIESNLSGGMKFALEFFYREGLVLDSASNVLGKSVVFVNGEEIVFDYDRNIDGKENLVHYLYDNFVERKKIADSLQKEFLVKVKAMRLDQALILRNQKITELVKSLDEGLKENTRDPSLNKLVRKVHDQYLSHVVNEEYQAYLEEADDKEHQAILGDSILLELHSIEEVYRLCTKISERRREIDSLYTEYTFDPFTFTDQVPTRIKRRLYDLVAEQMFNQMVNKATAEANAFQCEKDLLDLYDMLGSMITLKEKDTKKLEKNLKKHKNLEDRLKLLNEAL